jgi:hypothetical protein
MKVYLRDFRPGAIQTNISQPGLKHPDVADWMILVPIPGNKPPVPAPKTIKTVFRDGVAEVDQRLGAYLINEGIAFVKPQKAMAAA